SRLEIVRKLEFSSSTSVEKRAWLQNWVTNISDDLLKQFLFALSGSTAIGKESVIKIKDNSGSESPPVFFHTCFNIVDMPLNNFTSEKEFTDVLEGCLAGSQYDRG